MTKPLTLTALALIMAATPAMSTPLNAPDRFNHPYQGKLTIHRVDRSNVWRECSEGGRHYVRTDAAGCAFPGDGSSCTIFLAKRTRRAPLDAILLHEIAHCNGWPADHPK